MGGGDGANDGTDTKKFLRLTCSKARAVSGQVVKFRKKQLLLNGGLGEDLLCWDCSNYIHNIVFHECICEIPPWCLKTSLPPFAILMEPDRWMRWMRLEGEIYEGDE